MHSRSSPAPGALAAIVLLMGRADFWRAAVVLAALIVSLALTYLALLGAERLKALLGVTGAGVVGRVWRRGALAAQFTFDGLSEARLFAAIP